MTWFAKVLKLETNEEKKLAFESREDAARYCREVTKDQGEWNDAGHPIWVFTDGRRIIAYVFREEV